MIQAFGMFLVLVSVGFWMATGHLNTLIFSGALGLVGGGSAAAVAQKVARRRGPPGPNLGQREADE